MEPKSAPKKGMFGMDRWMVGGLNVRGVNVRGFARVMLLKVWNARMKDGKRMSGVVYKAWRRSSQMELWIASPCIRVWGTDNYTRSRSRFGKSANQFEFLRISTV
jgi:hypothetical protein